MSPSAVAVVQVLIIYQSAVPPGVSLMSRVSLSHGVNVRRWRFVCGLCDVAILDVLKTLV